MAKTTTRRRRARSHNDLAFAGGKPGARRGQLDTRDIAAGLAEPREAIVRIVNPMGGTELLSEDNWHDYLRQRLGETFEFLNEPATAEG
jgi:hypothetical protein